MNFYSVMLTQDEDGSRAVTTLATCAWIPTCARASLREWSDLNDLDWRRVLGHLFDLPKKTIPVQVVFPSII